LPPPDTILTQGVGQKGTIREVVDGEGTAFTFECYTLREAAEALYKTPLTLRRWIKEGFVPAMTLHDTSFNYGQYARGELNAMARVLAEHEQEYQYLRKEHEDTIRRLCSQVNRYRQQKGIR